MTLKIPIQETVKLVGSLRLCGRDKSEPVVVRKREMVTDEKVYVAVTGKDLESKSSLVWAIQNTGAREFCIVYVHQPTRISACKYNQFLLFFFFLYLGNSGSKDRTFHTETMLN